MITPHVAMVECSGGSKLELKQMSLKIVLDPMAPFTQVIYILGRGSCRHSGSSWVVLE
jgi:hypothetical protein